MCNIRCMYCKKYYVKSDGDKCIECEKEFKEVMNKMLRKCDGALKGLAKR